MQIALEQGIVPRALKARPVLFAGLDLYLTAFQELQHDRPTGMATGSIPWSSIVKWAEIHGMGDADSIALLNKHIRALEQEALTKEQT